MRLLKGLAAALVFLGIASSARADIVISLVGSGPTQNSDGTYTYTYGAQLAGGQLDKTVNGTPVQFGTLYDAGTFTNFSTTGLLSTNEFNFVFANVNNPAAYKTVPVDDPATQNIRFYYVGSTDYAVTDGMTTNPDSVLLAATPANLGTFSFVSTESATRVVDYDGQSYKGSNNTIQGNVGSTVAPAAVTPEPSSLVLLGTGLLGAVGAMKRRLA